MDVLVNGISMHVESEGSGPALLVLHGFTGSAENWTPFIPSWSRHFKVIAPDLIGHGHSDAPEDRRRYAMDQAADDLAALLDQLGVSSAHVLGYSMGGRLALTFAVRYPERVETLILESSSPGLETKQERIERVKRDEALANRIEEVGVEAFVDDWENIQLFSTQSEEVKRILREQRVQNRSIGLAGSLRGMGTGAQKSLWRELETMRVPVKLIVGELDGKFRKIAENMKKRLPNAEMITVSDAGHALHVEQSRFFDRMVLEFLNQDPKGMR